MKNILASRRLGQSDTYAPGEPTPTGLDSASLQASLGAQRNDANQFRDQLTQRNLERQGRGTLDSVLGETSASPAQPDQGVQRRNLMTQFALANREALADGTMTMDDISRQVDGILGGESTGSQGQEFPQTPQGAQQAATFIERTAPYIQPMIESAGSLADLRGKLKAAKVKPDSQEWKAAEAAYLGRRSPGEQEREQAASAEQARRRAIPATPWFSAAPGAFQFKP
jgi:hypothetical protein